MSTRTRTLMIILNTLCIPVNVLSISKAFEYMHKGDWAGGVLTLMLATFALVWCAFMAVTDIRILIKVKQDERRNLRF